MDKRAKQILWAIGIAILALIVIETLRPKPINWNPSYSASDKIPFGSYILYNELENFYNVPVKKIDTDPFLFIEDTIKTKNALYIFINNQINFDKQQYKKLNQFVKTGNSVFLSSRYLSTFFKDSLKLNTFTKNIPFQTEIKPAFFNKNIQLDTLPTYKKQVFQITFTAIDTSHTTALGYFKNSEKPLENINFIKVKYGEGYYYFHTLPEAFSNYYLLKEPNQKYVEALLSHVNPTIIYWDNYIKSGRRVINSPLRFILTQPPLKWAYYLTLLGLVLFVIFKGKREQRIIPVKEPLKNTAIAFTKTISDLHFQHKDYSNIIAKKITYFFEKIRSKYHLDTQNLDASFIKNLAIKSGHSLEDTQKLIDTIKTIKEKSFHTEKDLIYLNKLIEAFTL
jgi:hypothetical protein